MQDDDDPRQGLRRAADAPAAGVPAPLLAAGRAVRLGGHHRRCAGAALAQPYLMKVAIDQPHRARASSPGSTGSPRLYLVVLVVAFAAEYIQTWTMQLTGQRIMFDMRMAHLRPSAAARPALLRPQPGRPPDDARHVGRRRAERPVHLGRRHHLRRRLHAGRHHGRDAVDELAAGAGGVRRAAADRAHHPVVPPQRARVLPRRPRPGSPGSTPSCRRTSPGWRRCSCSGARR